MQQQMSDQEDEGDNMWRKKRGHQSIRSFYMLKMFFTFRFV
jgi:hypothetical protein